MDKSQEVVPAEVSAPEQVATAAPEAEELVPEAVEPTAEAPKTLMPLLVKDLLESNVSGKENRQLERQKHKLEKPQ